MLIFSDASVNLCPNSMMRTLPKPLHEYACTRSLTLPQFCHSGRHCFGKDPQCSPYLPQVISVSFSHSLAWLCLWAQHPPEGEPSFGVTVCQLCSTKTSQMWLFPLTTPATSGFNPCPRDSGWWLELQPSRTHSRQWEGDKDEEEEGKGSAPALF